MLKEIGLASGLLSSVFDKLKSEKDKDTTGAESFGAVLGNGMQVSLNTLDASSLLEEAGTKKVSAGAGSTDGMKITNLLGGDDITDDGVNSSDKVSAGTSEALSMLKEMTSGGVEGYFRFIVKNIREKVMKDMGVSEEQLAAMPADERKAIEDKIAEEVKKQVAKIMGTDPETAQKMIAEADKVQGVGAAGKVEASKAYKEGGQSLGEMLSQLFNS